MNARPGTMPRSRFRRSASRLTSDLICLAIALPSIICADILMNCVMKWLPSSKGWKHDAFHLQRPACLSISLHVHRAQPDIMRGDLVLVRRLKNHSLERLVLLHAE